LYYNAVGHILFKNTKSGQLILRKNIKIVATRYQFLRPKCTKVAFGWGSPRPSSCMPTSKGRERKGKRKGRRGKGKGRERGTPVPQCETLATPLSNCRGEAATKSFAPSGKHPRAATV